MLSTEIVVSNLIKNIKENIIVACCLRLRTIPLKNEIFKSTTSGVFQKLFQTTDVAGITNCLGKGSMIFHEIFDMKIPIL